MPRIFPAPAELVNRLKTKGQGHASTREAQADALAGKLGDTAGR
jgi:hypothetical protein